MRRPAPRTNPAPWPFKTARATSQNGVQGAESAPFAAGFEAFPLRVGASDKVQSIRLGPVRLFRCDSVERGAGSGRVFGERLGLSRQSRRRKDAQTCEEDESVSVYR